MKKNYMTHIYRWIFIEILVVTIKHTINRKRTARKSKSAF